MRRSVERDGCYQPVGAQPVWPAGGSRLNTAGTVIDQWRLALASAEAEVVP